MSPDSTTAPPQPAPARRPRGRPRIFDETRKSVLCKLLSIGLSRNEACRNVGVPPSSVVHAARTDPAFATRLRQALIDRASRPPELADFGSRSWRTVARRLEARSRHFRLPSSRTQRLTERRLRRIIRRTVKKPAEESPLNRSGGFQPPSTARLLFQNPPRCARQRGTKTIIPPRAPIIVSKPPWFFRFTRNKNNTPS
jgi:hypothetical protein